MNAQGAEVGVLGTTVISYPRTVQILAGYGDLHHQSLVDLVSASGMGDHLIMSELMKLFNDPEGRNVRRFVEEFLAEFVALDGKFSDYLKKMKRPICTGKAVLTMLKGMVDHLKSVALANMPQWNTTQQQSETQVRPQWTSAPAPQDNGAFVTEVEQQSGHNNAQGVNPYQQQQQHPLGLGAGMGMMGGALPFPAQQGGGQNGMHLNQFSDFFADPNERLRASGERFQKSVTITESGNGILELPTATLKELFTAHYVPAYRQTTTRRRPWT